MPDQDTSPPLPERTHAVGFGVSARRGSCAFIRRKLRKRDAKFEAQPTLYFQRIRDKQEARGVTSKTRPPSNQLAKHE